MGLALDRETLRQVSGRTLILGVGSWLLLAVGGLLAGDTRKENLQFGQPYSHLMNVSLLLERELLKPDRIELQRFIAKQ